MPVNIRTITDPEVLRELSESSDYFTLVDVVENVHTPADVLIKLSYPTDENDSIPRLALRNPVFPVHRSIEIIEKNTDNIYIIMAAISHPDLPYELLLKIAKEATNDLVIMTLLGHEKVTLEIVETILANVRQVPEFDYDYYVLGFRVLVGKTKELPILYTVYEKLPGLADAIASNKHCDPALLDRIAKEQPNACSSVAKHKMVTPQTLSYLRTHDYIWTRTKVAWNPNTEVADLDFLSYDREPKVREAVAKNKNTPADILDRLEDDRSLPVRRAVAASKIKRELL